MKIKAALHVHVKGDPLDDIPYDFKELVDYAHKLNFKVIALTCHNSIFPIAKAKKYAAKKEILIISGIELSIKKQHIVILNPSQKILKVKSLDDLKKYKSINKNSFILAPHPYYPNSKCLRKNLEKYIDVFDGIEFNFFYTKTINFNKKALQIAKKHSKPIIGTSDCHILKYLNETYSEVELPDNTQLTVNTFIQALKSNRINLVTQPLSPFKCASILLQMLLM